MNKAFRAAFGAALVLAVIAVGAVSVSLGRIVKSAVEAAGPRLLGAPVTVDFVAISPWSGRGTLRGLVIGNPAGFAGPRAVRVGLVDVTVRLSSLLSDTVVVERVAVREPEIAWEVGNDGASNVTRLQRNAEESAAKLTGSSAGAAPAKKGKSLLIQDFEVTGGKVLLSATALGGRGLTGPLPDVHLENLGGPGRTPADAAAEALRAVTASAQKAVSSVGSKALGQAADSARALFGAFLKAGGK